MRYEARSARTFPLLLEGVVHFVGRSAWGGRLVERAENWRYGQHVVKETLTANNAAQLNELIVAAHTGSLTGSPSLSRDNLQRAVGLDSLRQQASGRPSERFIRTTIPGNDSWAGHRVGISLDGRKRDVACIRQYTNGQVGIRDSVVYYMHPIGEVVVVDREAHLFGRDHRTIRSNVSTFVRFTPGGKILLAVEETESRLRGRPSPLRRYAAVVDGEGRVIPSDTMYLQHYPQAFWQ